MSNVLWMPIVTFDGGLFANKRGPKRLELRDVAEWPENEGYCAMAMRPCLRGASSCNKT
jgi:hypothetical protein